LRFLGIPEDTGREKPETSLFKLRKILKYEFGLEKAEELKITRAHRTGAQNSKYPRPIIALFENHEDRMLVWKARFNVKEGLLKCQEDFPAEILERRKILLPTFHAIRTFNINAEDDDKIDVALVIDRLYVGNRLFNIHNIHQVRSPYKPEELAMREIDNTIFFFGNACPYSNHHKCGFHVDGNNFMCMEQFMFAKKAEKAKDRISFDKIMASSDPVEQKRLGANIQGMTDHEWESIAFDLMKPGIYAKFSQNNYLRARLLATEDKLLAECSRSDGWWGISMSLSDPDLGKKRFQGLNRLGDLLMFTRTELKKMHIS
jgi:hypothetical protein